ncbi:MAG: group II intron reverse transcriptase/maturase [Microcystaceae cyanobacterium]
MMANLKAGAASHSQMNWHSIDWYKVHQIVRRLQARIVKATQEGRWGKVKALQHLLTHSFSAKALAVKQVTENHGKRTPGIDGETWECPQKKLKAVDLLRQRGYQAQPLRRVYIAKSNGQKRPLGIATMKDRAMQTLYLLALDPIAEVTADKNSYGFRKSRATADAIEQCFIALSRKDSSQWILEGDIQSCFNEISHDWLLTYIPMDKAMLRKWLKAGFMSKYALHPTEAGVPQGSSISPVIANMALDSLESRLRVHFPLAGAKGRKTKVHLSRYADDFCITGYSKELLEQKVKPLVEQFLQERGLTLSLEKTRITHINDGFDFLGQNVRKYNGKLLIKPSKKNVQAFINKIREIIKVHKQISAGKLIEMLNPVIRGWANYHRHVVSKETFQRMDCAIFKCLWQWARRRHRHKGSRWIRRKYFRSLGNQSWIFFGEVTRAGGETRNINLLMPGEVVIQRHTKIRGDANPYDPAWESYFDQRLGLKWLQGTNRKRLINLWKAQKGKCPICEQRITKETGWNVHHITYRVHGGTDNQSNLALLHPNCHRQVHSQEETGVKPGVQERLGEA